MPSLGSSQAPSSTAKRQQASISSFFTSSQSTKGPSKVKENGSHLASSDHAVQEPKVNLIREASYPSPKKTSNNSTHNALNDLCDPDFDDLDLVQPVRKRPRMTPETDIRAPTSRYAFSSSQVEEPPEDDETVQRKEKLHADFVKKLGRPDSISEIKRRNFLISEETQEQDAEDDDADDLPRKPAGKKGASKLTPMEKQYLQIKLENLEAIIIYEVGYKFKFFGEDARVAARELGIVCIPGKFRYDEHASEAHYDRFASASIPVHRLHVHVKRLVAAGHKVGVVRQVETAALKAVGDNRYTPFVRKLTNLYTKGTYVDESDELESGNIGSPTSGYLVCLTEQSPKGWGTDEKVMLGMIAVQPSTGDVIHDNFDDGFMRSELETRLLHIAPCEILIVGDLSKATDKLVSHLAGSKANVFGDQVRVERMEKGKTMAAEAFSHVSTFYTDKRGLEKVLQLPEAVTICLSAMITHLTSFGLEHVFDLTKYFQSFSARSHMLLNATSLTSLEIYQNQTDHTEKGSLFWTLNRTKTKFGQRLLRKWVGRPLLMPVELQARLDAVEELTSCQQSMKLDGISNMLSQTNIDLEKSLIRIYYGKCLRSELVVVLQTLQKIASQFIKVKSPEDAGFRSSLLNEAIAVLPTIYDDMTLLLSRINAQAAKANDKYSFFREEDENDTISGHKLGIASVEQELDAHRTVAAETLRRRRVDYVTVAGIEYLIELESSMTKHVPASWAKISGTKRVSRFHTPDVVRMIRERDQYKESLAAACDQAFVALLTEVSSKYQAIRDCIQSLALLDCLLSLASIAQQPGYVRPEIQSENQEICVEGARHPMVEQLLLDNYVPNDIHLMRENRALLITGPNMGGKSSYVRQVALISIMAQIGSYVPATRARLGILDGVFTRMGAFDNMMAGESTFMVELSETADILKQATPRSLVILDELGRGTSTHDGVAIAQAVLDFLVREKRCLVLFITHYQTLSLMANNFPDGELANVHMRFAETGNGEITFLYEIGHGVAHRSYGLNVARLAQVPHEVIDLAGVKSTNLETEIRARGLSKLGTSLRRLLEQPIEAEIVKVLDQAELL